MNLNKFTHGSIANDGQMKKVLISRGIEQAWHRRFCANIHTGVRVKVQGKSSLCLQSSKQHIHRESKSISLDRTSRVQSMLKRLWIESETSALSQNGQKALERTPDPSSNKLSTSYRRELILNNSFLGKHHSKVENMNNIGIQTTAVPKIDQQTSCDFAIPTSKRVQRSPHNRSSTTTSPSETSLSDENSSYTGHTLAETSAVSSTISDTKENDDHHVQHRRNKNRNNNAIDADTERRSNHIKIEDAKIQLANNETSLQDIHINKTCYPQSTLTPVVSAGKRRFFSPLFKLFSFLRLSSFQRNRIDISTTNVARAVITDDSRSDDHNTIRSPTSRCRRSTARKLNSTASVQPKNNSFQIGPEDDISSRIDQLKQKVSIHSITDMSMFTKKPDNQANNSSLTTEDSQINLEKTLSHQLRTTNRRERSHRKAKIISRYHGKKHTHRRRRKHLQLSHSQTSTPSIPNKIQPLPPIQEQSTILLDEKVKKTSFTSPDPDNNPPQTAMQPLQESQEYSSKCTDNHSLEVVPYSKNQAYSLPLPSHTKRHANKQYFPADSIRLRVQNKNLLSTLSNHVDDSVQYHQMNIITELKSLLQPTKRIHINNNALDGDLTVNPRKIPINEISSVMKTNAESKKNQNDNKYQRASMDSQSTSTVHTPLNLQHLIQGENEIIREGVDQLKRYQQFAQQYKLKSNKAVRQFLLESNVLSSESLNQLSRKNEPLSTPKLD